MENTFKFLQQSSIIWNSDEFKENERDITKMFNMGIVVKESGRFKVNPLVKTAKSVTDAKNKLKSKVNSWLNEMNQIENAQNRFREEMVDYFKSNPVETTSLDYFHLPSGTPDKYRTGKGYAYLVGSDIISLHFGYKPPNNIPTNCDRFKFECNGGLGILINV